MKHPLYVPCDFLFVYTCKKEGEIIKNNNKDTSSRNVIFFFCTIVFIKKTTEISFSDIYFEVKISLKKIIIMKSASVGYRLSGC